VIELVLIVFQTVLLAFLIYKLSSFQRSLPDVQEVLDDVGTSIAEQLSSVLEKPMVKRAMSTLGKQSGEVRADNALRERAADKILGQYPSINLILDQLKMTPMEGLQLLNDPLIGPFIKGAIQKGIGGFLKGNPESSSYGKY